MVQATTTATTVSNVSTATEEQLVRFAQVLIDLGVRHAPSRRPRPVTGAARLD